MTELQNALPPEWDCSFDKHTGRYYYVNHLTKTTTWDDPRARPRQIPNVSRSVAGEYIPLKDFKPATRSPITLKTAKVKDSSFTVPNVYASSDSDESVSKIGAMFPTVSESHIKLLLKNSRYMKSIFPEADETTIHEVLQNNDSNIQKSSEILKEMGYTKKDTVKANVPKSETVISENVEATENAAVTVPTTPHIMTNDEKQILKEKLQNQYKDVAEHLISIALESVHFNEDRATQILNIMKQEDSENDVRNKKVKESSSEAEPVPSTSEFVLQIPISQSRQSIKSLLKVEKSVETSGFSRIVNKSNYLSNTVGHNSELAKGPNEKLLLENYVQWHGCNNGLQKGPQGLAKGPNKNLLSSKMYKPCGPKIDLHKGPVYGLSKGSIYNQAEFRVK